MRSGICSEQAVSIHVFRASNEMDSGRDAEGYCLYIELFGFTLELTLCRGR